MLVHELKTNNRNLKIVSVIPFPCSFQFGQGDMIVETQLSRIGLRGRAFCEISYPQMCQLKNYFVMMNNVPLGTLRRTPLQTIQVVLVIFPGFFLFAEWKPQSWGFDSGEQSWTHDSRIADEIEETTSGGWRDHTGSSVKDVDSRRSKEKLNKDSSTHHNHSQMTTPPSSGRTFQKKLESDRKAKFSHRSAHESKASKSSRGRSKYDPEQDGKKKNMHKSVVCVKECLHKRKEKRETDKHRRVNNTLATEQNTHNVKRMCERDCRKHTLSPPPLPEADVLRALFPNDTELLRALEDGHEEFYKCLKLRLSQHPDYVKKYKGYLKKHSSGMMDLDVQEGGESHVTYGRQNLSKEGKGERTNRDMAHLSDDPKSFSHYKQADQNNRKPAHRAKGASRKIYNFSKPKKSNVKSKASALGIAKEMICIMVFVVNLI